MDNIYQFIFHTCISASVMYALCQEKQKTAYFAYGLVCSNLSRIEKEKNKKFRPIFLTWTLVLAPTDNRNSNTSQHPWLLALIIQVEYWHNSVIYYCWSTVVSLKHHTCQMHTWENVQCKTTLHNTESEDIDQPSHGGSHVRSRSFGEGIAIQTNLSLCDTSRIHAKKGLSLWEPYAVHDKTQTSHPCHMQLF